MANGDWHPESRAEHTLVQIQLTDAGEVHHVGASFAVKSPNGRALTNHAYSWPIPTETRKRLEAIMQELNSAIVRDEGLAGMDFKSFPEHTPERQQIEASEKGPEPEAAGSPEPTSTAAE